MSDARPDDVPLTMDLVLEVREVLAPHLRATPILRSDWLSARHGADVYLKCENLQRTGSFKIRGAFAALSRLSPEERARGVVATSAGNHGQGVALAARTLGIPCTIAVPSSVPRVKADAIRAHGATLLVSPHAGWDDTASWAEERFAEIGGRFIPAFEDTVVIAGNGGTLGLEVVEALPDIDAIVVPCGGGGCVTGIGVVTQARAARTRVLGVNTDASPGMYASFRDGQPHLRVESAPTIAEGIEGGVTERGFTLAWRYVDDVLLAREATIRSAVAGLAREERMIVEGSGAAGVAAILDGVVPAKRVCVVMTGSNIDRDRLVELLGEQL